MPIKLLTKEDPGEWVFWGNDPDNGKPISLRIRRPEPGYNRRALKAVYRNMRHEQVAKQTEAQRVDQGFDFTIEKAAHVLLDSRNFSAVATPETEAQLGKPGTEIVLDGKWTDEIKRAVLASMPESFAAWIIKKADELASVEAEAEAAAEESFR